MNIFQKSFGVLKTVWREFGSDSGQSFNSWINSKLHKQSPYELLGQYKNLVYSCITAIAEDVAKYEPIFYTKDSRTGEKKVTNHIFKDLLEKPNESMSQYELFESTQSYIELTGEAFWYLTVGEQTRKPKEIYILRPDRVLVAIDETTGKVTGYTYNRGDGSNIPLDLDEVIHFKTYNPRNPYRGLGSVQAGLLYIETENSTSQFQYNFMHNQASPSGILSLKGTIGSEAFNKLKTEWRENQAGIDNAGKTLIIRNTEATFEKVGLSLGDIDMKALKDITQENLLKIFRMPKSILGENDSVGLGRASIEAAEYIFAKRVIDPKLTRIDDTLRLYVNKIFKDKEIYIGHSSQVPDDEAAELNEYDKAVDRWMTRNEIREAQGLDPVDGGDTLYYSFNQLPITQEPTAPTNESTAGKKIKIVVKDVKKKLNLSDFLKVTDRFERKSKKEYESGLNRLLNIQRSKVLSKIGSLGKSKKKQTVSVEGLAFTLLFTKDELRLNLLESLIQALFSSGKIAIELLGQPSNEFIVEQSTRDAIFNSTERLMKSFNEETALKLQKQLAEGIANGESSEELKKRVESIYEEATGFRADRIARTEAHSAVNEGVAVGYKYAGVTQMIWRTRNGACEYCLAMEGQITDIGTPFLDKGQTVNSPDGGEFKVDYKDIQYADLHPHCDCYLEPIINS